MSIIGKIPNRAKRRKPQGVFILEFKDVIDYLGGKARLKSKAVHSEEAYSLLVRGQDALTKDLHRMGFEEVVQLHTTDLGDWANNNFDPPDFVEAMREKYPAIYNKIKRILTDWKKQGYDRPSSHVWLEVNKLLKTPKRTESYSGDLYDLVDDFALAFGLRPHIWWGEK